MLILARGDRLTSDVFEGYAFVGHDYVHGASGAASYTAEKGLTIGPGEDGAYVVARRHGRTVEVGTDAQGLGRLFLYRRGRHWVLGSSFTGVVDYVRKHRLPLKLQPARMRPFGARTVFTMQLTTFQTPFDEIELLPVGTVAEIRGRRIRLRRERPRADSSYEQALADFLSIWRGRTRTLASDERVTFTADLSGGIDSRTVAAFLIESALFDTSTDRNALRSNPAQTADFAAAAELASQYGLQLNGSPRPTLIDRSGKRAYRHWREHSLSVYTPVYIAATFHSPLHVHAHGGGGGTVRPFYKHDRPSQMVDDYTGRMPPEDLEIWRRDVERAEKQLFALAPDTALSIQHYTEFRNRFHFGHIPKGRPLFTPLNSLYAARALAVIDQTDRRQFYFDVMESLVPGLKDHPYDGPEKAPAERHNDAMTALPLPEAAPGRVFASEGAEESGTTDLGPDGYTLWLQDIERAIQRKPVRDFLMGNAVSRLEVIIDRMREQGRPFHSHSPQSVQLSYLLLVDYMLGS